MKQNIKNLFLLIAIILGFSFHNFFAKLSGTTPYLLFFMLFLAFSSAEIKKIKFTRLHFFLAIYQITVSLAIYFAIRIYDQILAQGAMICVLAPTAVSAIVIASMLKADIASVTSYSILINIIISIVAPIYFSFMNHSEVINFWTSFITITQKIFPLLIMPLLLAISIKITLPKINRQISKISGVSFYLWVVAAAIVMGNAMNFVISQETKDMAIIIMLSAISLIICLLQFILAYRAGKKYNDAQASCQSLGQKNTILAIWMAQTFLNPLSSLAPASYVIWQNLVNSFQLWVKNRKKTS